MLASSKGRVAVVQALLKAGADAEAQDQNGETCLHAAVQARRVRVVESLLELGDARLLAIQCGFGRTPLQLSMFMGERCSAITALLRAAA